jgi:hypothetical protein
MDTSRPDRPTEDDTQGRRLFEHAIPEFIKRVIETGVGKIAEGPESVRSFVADLKLPKEVANYLFAQIEETKNGLHRVVAKEIRSYLEQSDLAGDLAKALGRVSIQIKTEIRFMPDDGKPRVQSKVELDTHDRPGSGAADASPDEPKR